jgi:MoaA/NifB/PqqE/SkfB family radical SAM enzyme
MGAQMIRSREEYMAIRERERQNKAMYCEGSGLALAPHTICLSVNNNCFMSCKMCDIGAANSGRLSEVEQGYFSRRYAKHRGYVEFPFDRIKDLVDEMSPYSPIFKTNFVEPLLYRRIRDVAEYVKGKGLKYYTITNGWTLARHVPWLIELEADLVRVSLDGVPNVHDFIRGRPGSFERTLSGITELLKQRDRRGQFAPILGICYTISNFNYFNIVDFMEYLRLQGILERVYVNFNHLQFTTPWEVAATKAESEYFDHLCECSLADVVFSDIDVAVLETQLHTVAERFDQEKYHYYFSPWLQAADLSDFYSPEKWMFPRTPCFLPWQAAQIEIDGSLGVYGHCILPTFGNIMESSFMEVWNSTAAAKIRTDLKRNGSFPACNRCIGTLYPLRGRD